MGRTGIHVTFDQMTCRQYISYYMYITGCRLCNAAVNANNILCPECIQLFCTMDTRDYVDITASCLKGKLHHPINVISQVECSVIV